MTDTNEVFIVPADFQDRARALNARINAGEPMTMEYIAQQLGLPFEFFAAALAVEIALQSGQPVFVDTSPAPKKN